MANYVGALDQGTTSTRFMIFDHGGQVVGLDQKEHEQIYPKPGWVEHDPQEIWERSQSVIRGALDKAGISAATPPWASRNQRETTVVWDRATGKPIYNAIVWQDTRTDRIVNELGRDGGQDRLRGKTGLPLATYFSGPKAAWILDSVDGAREKAEAGAPVREHRHVVHLEPHRRHRRRRPHHRRDEREPDAADEPRDARLGRRDPRPDRRPAGDAAGDQGVERSVRRGVGELEGIPIAGDLGDQQAALFGQTCFSVGEEHVRDGELPAAQHRHRGGAVQERPADDARLQDRRPARGVLLEGAIAITGALAVARDNIGLVTTAPEIESLAKTVDDNGGVYFVPRSRACSRPTGRTTPAA